jgi:hypothetical protein
MFEFINTVLILILINAKVPELNIPDELPILTGSYADFNIPWYRNVGSTLMLTMLINVVAPHITEKIFYMKTLYSRWRDRSFTCDMRQTKQVLQEDYN